MKQPYSQGGLLTDYIWAAMLCILLSAFGDIIDGPIARRYSKKRLLGGSLGLKYFGPRAHPRTRGTILRAGLTK